MSKIVENSKGFKVIAISDRECKEKIGGLGICDDCNKDFQTAFYVAVLNHSYCQECYDSWMTNAIKFPEDRKYEEENFNRMKETLATDVFDMEYQFELFLKKTGGNVASEKTQGFVKDVFFGSFCLFLELLDGLSNLPKDEGTMALDKMAWQLKQYMAEKLLQRMWKK